MENTNIEAAGTVDFLKKAGELLFKGLDKILKNASDIQKETVEKGGKIGHKYKFPLDDNPNGYLIATIYPVKDSKKYLIDEVEGEGRTVDGDPVVIRNWKPTAALENQVVNILNKALTASGISVQVGKADSNDPEEEEAVELKDGQEAFKNEEAAPVEEPAQVASNIRICARLSKIEASEDLELRELCTNGNPATTMNIISEVANSPEIVDLFNDSDEICVAITDDGTDEYDIEQLEDIDSSSTIETLFECAVGYASNLQAIGWACGDQDVQNCLNGTLTWTAVDVVNQLARIYISETGKYPHAGLCEINCIDVSSGLKRDDAFNYILHLTSEIVDTLDMYYVNLSHEVQALVDTWMNQLKNGVEVDIVRILNS